MDRKSIGGFNMDNFKKQKMVLIATLIIIVATYLLYFYVDFSIEPINTTSFVNSMYEANI